MIKEKWLKTAQNCTIRYIMVQNGSKLKRHSDIAVEAAEATVPVALNQRTHHESIYLLYFPLLAAGILGKRRRGSPDRNVDCHQEKDGQVFVAAMRSIDYQSIR